MRYFVPDIRVATEAPNIRERLGGVPFGLPSERWPVCSTCGRSQSLLAQFEHHPDRLDLGRSGRMLFVFQCNHDPGMCDTWEKFSGANSCFVIEPEHLTDADSITPEDQPPLDREVRVHSWIERDIQLPAFAFDAFSKGYDYIHVPEEVQAAITFSTRQGGIPRWIQSADEAPGEGWRFVAQLDETYSFLKAPEHDHSWVSADHEQFEGRSHLAVGPNFGMGGLGYIFLRSTQNVPDACFFWQR